MKTNYSKVPSEASTVQTETEMTTICSTVPSEGSTVQTDTKMTTIYSTVPSKLTRKWQPLGRFCKTNLCTIIGKVIVIFKCIRPLLFFSLFLVTSKLQKLCGLVKKKMIWAKKKKVIRLPTSSSSSGDNVFQALNGCFSLQHCGIRLHFCSKHVYNKRKRKKREKEVKCQTHLAAGDNHACVSMDRSWYCSWVSCVKLWNMNSSILQTLPSFSRHSVAQDFR